MSRGRVVGVSVLLVAVLVTAVAAALVWRGVLERDGGAAPTPSPTPAPGAQLTGPLDLLLVGVDTRESQPTWPPKADAVMVMHVPGSHDRAYLFSVPRDLLVDVPAYPPADFGGQRTKLTHAMSYGSRVPGQVVPDPAQGLELMTRTVGGVTGIEQFDGAAVLTFTGFTDLVTAVGGVDVTLDQRIASEHRQPDGTLRPLQPDGTGYTGPQQVYEPGEQHLVGWQALDVARQRNLPGGDYTRQEHQRLLVTALVRQLYAEDLVTDPARALQVREALGDTLLFSGRGSVVDFAFALRDVWPEQIERVGLPGASVVDDGEYLGERLEPVADDFFAAVRDDRVASFLAAHPDLVDE